MPKPCQKQRLFQPHCYRNGLPICCGIEINFSNKQPLISNLLEFLKPENEPLQIHYLENHFSSGASPERVLSPGPLWYVLVSSELFSGSPPFTSFSYVSRCSFSEASDVCYFPVMDQCLNDTENNLSLRTRISFFFSRCIKGQHLLGHFNFFLLLQLNFAYIGIFKLLYLYVIIFLNIEYLKILVKNCDCRKLHKCLKKSTQYSQMLQKKNINSVKIRT